MSLWCWNEIQDIHYCNSALWLRRREKTTPAPIYWVFVTTLNPHFVLPSPSLWQWCLCSSDTNSGHHQQQTRSVPLDWVFVVPPGTLVAVGTLKMKDHHCHPDTLPSADCQFLGRRGVLLLVSWKNSYVFKYWQGCQSFIEQSLCKRKTWLQNFFSTVWHFWEFCDFQKSDDLFQLGPFC